MSDSPTAALEDDLTVNRKNDRFISLQLIPLLALPGIPLIIFDVLSICGVRSDEIGAIRNGYITLILVGSLATLFIMPAFFLIYIIYMGIMNIVRRYLRRTITFFVIIGLNIFTLLSPFPSTVDVQYLRFLVKKQGYELQVLNLRKVSDTNPILFVFDFDSQAIIVFDETDEVSRPGPSRSREWRANASAFPILRNYSPLST